MRDLEFPIQKEAQTGRVWSCRAENVDCTRARPCRSCLGRRNRRKGAQKQRDARKALGVPSSRFGSQNAQEENWRGCVRVEVKAGAQVGPLATRFLKAEKQSEASRAVGDGRPFVFVAMPDGMSDGLMTLRLSSWETHIAPLIDEYGDVA